MNATAMTTSRSRIRSCLGPPTASPARHARAENARPHRYADAGEEYIRRSTQWPPGRGAGNGVRGGGVPKRGSLHARGRRTLDMPAVRPGGRAIGVSRTRLDRRSAGIAAASTSRRRPEVTTTDRADHARCLDPDEDGS